MSLILNPQYPQCPRLEAHPKSRVPVGVANPPTPLLRGGISRSFLRALGSPFPGGFASQLGLRPSSGEADRWSGFGTPGFPATLLEKGFPGNARRGAVPGFFLLEEGGDTSAGLSSAELCSSWARRAWGKLRDPGTGRAGEAQPFEVRFRGNVPAVATAAESDTRPHLSRGGSTAGL